MKKVSIIVCACLVIGGLMYYSYHYYHQLQLANKKVHKLNKKVQNKTTNNAKLEKENQTFRQALKENETTQRLKNQAFQASETKKAQLELNLKALYAFFDYENQTQRMETLKRYTTSDLYQQMNQAKSDVETGEVHSELKSENVYYASTENGFSTVNIVSVTISSVGHEEEVRMLAHFNYVKDGDVYKVAQNKFIEY